MQDSINSQQNINGISKELRSSSLGREYKHDVSVHLTNIAYKHQFIDIFSSVGTGKTLRLNWELGEQPINASSDIKDVITLVIDPISSV